MAHEAAGTRAAAARTLIRKASERVCDRITLQSMQQSFPDFTDSDGAYIQELQETTVQHLMAGFEVLLAGCWNPFRADGATGSLGGPVYHQRVQGFYRQSESSRQDLRCGKQQTREEGASGRCMAVRGSDRCGIAADRKARKAADPNVAIQAAVVPKLQAHVDTLNQLKIEVSLDQFIALLA